MRHGPPPVPLGYSLAGRGATYGIPSYLPDRLLASLAGATSGRLLLSHSAKFQRHCHIVERHILRKTDGRPLLGTRSRRGLSLSLGSSVEGAFLTSVAFISSSASQREERSQVAPANPRPPPRCLMALVTGRSVPDSAVNATGFGKAIPKDSMAMVPSQPCPTNCCTEKGISEHAQALRRSATRRQSSF